MARILVDASAVYALLDADDRWHGAARAAFDAVRRRREEPLLTNFLVAECHALLLSRLGSDVARRWLLTNVWPIERVTGTDEEHAVEIIRRYDDKTFSYTDAASFAVMERLGIRRAVAFDPHYSQYGFEVVGPPE
ncbi:MAG: type II toxin-antitoxin system VapC family toxin [Thermoanaerobaculia bacterium]